MISTKFIIEVYDVYQVVATCIILNQCSLALVEVICNQAMSW